MQTHALLLSCSLGTIVCWGQGSVNFTNIDPAEEVNAPFYDNQGAPLTGPAYVAQLYAGKNPPSLAPVGAIATFKTNPALAGYFSAGEVDIPGSIIFPEGGPAWVQVRAWAVAHGATYEQAVAAGAYTGLSNVLFLSYTGKSDGGVPSIPVPLVGLQFLGVPEPAPWLLGLLGFGVLALLPRRRCGA
jgi:MYXO-CTERM domain-containing protein